MATKPELTRGELALLRAAAEIDAPVSGVTAADRPSAAGDELSARDHIRVGDRTLQPRRRRSDYQRRAALTSTAAEREAAGSLKKEVLAPFGLGVLVVIATLAVIGLIASRSNASVFSYADTLRLSDALIIVSDMT